jgi:uncharacterized membrane protein (DUF106 family)
VPRPYVLSRALKRLNLVLREGGSQAGNLFLSYFLVLLISWIIVSLFISLFISKLVDTEFVTVVRDGIQI